MANDVPSGDLDRLLTALDSAAALNAQTERHRGELRELLLGSVDVFDGLSGLEAQCEALQERGIDEAPRRTTSILARKMRELLKRTGVVEIEAVGQPLDLERHEVVALRGGTSVEEDTVLEVVLRGYLWNDEILRRAHVVVARRDADCDAVDGGSQEGR